MKPEEYKIVADMILIDKLYGHLLKLDEVFAQELGHDLLNKFRDKLTEMHQRRSVQIGKDKWQ
jgi:hypothetical protein